MSEQFYKGRTNNHLTWVMVDATDFATPESAMSAATKIKIWGKLRGQAAPNFVSSGTGSLTNDIVHVGPSVLGMYTIALLKADLSDASAAWYDQYVISLSATGAAYQTLIADGGIDASAILAAAVQGNSRILIAQSQASDAYSAIIAPLASMTSDIASAVWAHAVGAQVNSRLLVAQSYLSDIRSNVSDMQSDFQSRVPKLVANNSQLSDLVSDLRSMLLIYGSQISDLDSALTSRFSDLHSFVSTTGVQLNASSLSDIRSAITANTPTLSTSDISDIASAVAAAVTFTVSASDMSDIASRVWATTAGAAVSSRVLQIASTASDAASAAQQANSRVLLNNSMTSDLQSKLSDVESNLLSFLATTGVQLNTSVMSDLRSAITGGTFTLSASDLSDIRSAITALGSDLRSQISSAGPSISDMASAVAVELASNLSDILSAAQQTNSRALVAKSSLSDIQSYLVAMSGMLSDVQSAVAAGGTVTVSNISDIASAVWANTVGAQVNSRLLVAQSYLSDIRSHVSDLQSDFQSRVPKLVATDSALSDFRSDLHSFVSTTGVQLNGSSLSDLRSAITGVTVTLDASAISDIASAVLAGAGTTSISASDMSDIASRVWAMAPATALTSRVLQIASTASDAASAAQQGNSRVLVLQSMASDIDSALTSRFSDLHSFVSTTGVQMNASSLSDIRSAITAGGAAALTTSDISDIASAVWANTIGARVDSRVLVNKSVISDVQSMVSDLQSDFQSRVPKLVATGSQLSDLSSDVKSAVTAGVAATLSSDLSDILSSARKANSQLLVNQSVLSDVQSALAVIPATKLAAHAAGVLAVVVGSGSSATTVKLSTVEGGAPSSTDDFYNGRVLIFTSGALAGQATSISDYTGTTTTATVVALTGSAVNGVSAVIV